MRCFVKKTLVVLISAALVLASFGVPASAAECTSRPEAVTFSFANTKKTGNLTAVCYYTDEYFWQSGTIADSHLRTMSLSMAMAAFESYREDDDDYTNRCENFEALMPKLGFSELYHNEAFDTKPTEDSIGVAIASKKIDVGSETYTLLAVALRGAGYKAEWGGNVKIGLSGAAEGFAGPRDQVLACIRNYEREHGITENAKIWIAGYSRGGAVSNLTAEALNQDPAAYATTADDIYCYTFEAPQGQLKANAGQYRNIHNTIFPADFVPMIPLSAWGFSRVGYTQEGQEEALSQDDFLLPAPGSEEYISRKDKMLDFLREIDPEIEYIIDNFTVYRYSQSDANPLKKLSQSEFMSDFIAWMNSTLPEQNRASFVENYQEAFSTLARFIMGATTQQHEAISAAMLDTVKDPFFYLYITALGFVISQRNRMSEADYNVALRETGVLIGKMMVKHMKKENAGYSEEDYRAFVDSITPVIRFGDAALEDDISNHFLYHLVTLLLNGKAVIQAHYPEISLAWVQSFDSYFNPSETTAHQLKYHEAKDATCSEEGNIEYWECGVCRELFADSRAGTRISPEEVLLEKTDHSWDEGVVMEEAKPGQEGTILYTCTECGKTKTARYTGTADRPAAAEGAAGSSPAAEVTVPAENPAEAKGPAGSGSDAITWTLILVPLGAMAAVVLIFVLWKRRKPDNRKRRE